MSARSVELTQPVRVEVRDQNCKLIGFVLMDDTPRCGATVRMEPGVTFIYRGYWSDRKRPMFWGVDHNAHALQPTAGHDKLTQIPGFFTPEEAKAWLI